MARRTDSYSYDADLSMFTLATVAAVLGFSLYCLWKPHNWPNLGIASHQTPTSLLMAPATSVDDESGGLVGEFAAGEARAEATESAPEHEAVMPKSAPSNVRKASRTS